MEEEVHISSDTSREIIFTFFWSYATHALDLAGKDKEYSSIHLTETWSGVYYERPGCRMVRTAWGHQDQAELLILTNQPSLIRFSYIISLS